MTAKAHHVTSNTECAPRYVSQNNSKMVCGEVIASLKKPTDTGRRSWYVRSQYDLRGGTTKIAKLNVCSINAAPVVPQSVPVPVPTPPTIPDIPLGAEAVAIIAP